eukprot:260719-Chlamydomonas_euryale.AAC.2
MRVPIPDEHPISQPPLPHKKQHNTLLACALPSPTDGAVAELPAAAGRQCQFHQRDTGVRRVWVHAFRARGTSQGGWGLHRRCTELRKGLAPQQHLDAADKLRESRVDSACRRHREARQRLQPVRWLGAAPPPPPPGLAVLSASI